MTHIRQAVILAGGLGTRMRPLTDDKPKPMIPVAGRPFLEYLVEQLKENGIEEIVLLLGYLPEVIQKHFGGGSKFGVRIVYSVTDVSDETGTRIRKAKELLQDRFILLNCDNYWPLDLPKLEAFYDAHDALVSSVVYSNKDRFTKNNMLVDGEGYVLTYDSGRTDPNLNGVDIAYAITDKRVFELLPEGNFHYEKTVFPLLIARRALAGFMTDTRYTSIGSIERLPATEAYFGPGGEWQKGR